MGGFEIGDVVTIKGDQGRTQFVVVDITKRGQLHLFGINYVGDAETMILFADACVKVPDKE